MVENSAVLFLVGGVFVTLVFLIIFIGLLIEERSKKKAHKAIGKELRQGVGLGAADQIMVEESKGSFLGRMWARITDLAPGRAKAQKLIDQADSKWSVEGYYMMGALYGLVLALTFYFIFPVKIIGGLIGLILGALYPRFILKRRRKKRWNTIEEQFPEAIDMLARAIRAGNPLSAGFKMVADDSPDPLASEFQQMFDEQALGLSLEESLQRFSKRVDIPDVHIFVTAVAISREVGGKYSEVFANISHTIRERFNIRGQIRVQTAQGRAVGTILAILPIAVGLLMFLAAPEYITVLFVHPWGKMALLAAGTLQFLGYLVIRKIVNIEI